MKSQKTNIHINTKGKQWIAIWCGINPSNFSVSHGGGAKARCQCLHLDDILVPWSLLQSGRSSDKVRQCRPTSQQGKMLLPLS